MIDSVQIEIGPAVGPAGTAEAQAGSLPVEGQVLAVRVIPSAGAPGTTRLRLYCEALGVQDCFVFMQGAGLETVIYPRRQMQASNGDPWEFTSEHPVVGCYSVYGPLRAEITHTNPGVSLTCVVLLER
jgi:hypothetical protein